MRGILHILVLHWTGGVRVKESRRSLTRDPVPVNITESYLEKFIKYLKLKKKQLSRFRCYQKSGKPIFTFTRHILFFFNPITSEVLFVNRFSNRLITLGCIVCFTLKSFPLFSCIQEFVSSTSPT